MEITQDESEKDMGDLDRNLNKDVIVVRKDIRDNPAAGVIILPKTPQIPRSPETPSKTDD